MVDPREPRLGRRFFPWFNRLAVPALRSRLAPLLFNPVSGWACVVWTTGRRSGRLRPVPLNYAIVDGGICCLAGFGRRSHWYRNVLADPRVTVDLPGRTVAGMAREVGEPRERLPRIRAVLRAAGWAGWTFALFPDRLSDAEVLARAAAVPVIEIRALGPAGDLLSVQAGSFDPGGRAWVPSVVGQILLGVFLVRFLADLRRAARTRAVSQRPAHGALKAAGRRRTEPPSRASPGRTAGHEAAASPGARPLIDLAHQIGMH